MKEVYIVYVVEGENVIFSTKEKAFEYAKQCIIWVFNNDTLGFFSNLDLDDCIEELKQTGKVSNMVCIRPYTLDSCKDI